MMEINTINLRTSGRIDRLPVTLALRRRSFYDKKEDVECYTTNDLQYDVNHPASGSNSSAVVRRLQLFNLRKHFKDI